MPIIIRETTIRANLSDADTPKNGSDTRPAAPAATAADLDGQVQKLLLRKLKARDER